MLTDSRVVPTVSYGFIEPIKRNVGAARIVPTRGIVTSRSAIAVSSTLSVSSGARFSSSKWRKPPSCIAWTSGPGENVSGV